MGWLFTDLSRTALINDLLDLGRIEAGFDSQKEITPLGAIVRYSLEGLTNAITSRSQVLELDIPNETPYVLGNPVRLRQMCFEGQAMSIWRCNWALRRSGRWRMSFFRHFKHWTYVCEISKRRHWKHGCKSIEVISASP